MWDYIATVKKGRAIVLTTHSMEEADALCNNIGIMIRGQMRALGTSQQLKSDHGEGYMVTIRIEGKPDFEQVGLMMRSV
jgi:ABC-type multidrug transport system ATPase subunit